MWGGVRWSVICCMLIVSVMPQRVLAQGLYLPKPGTMVNLTAPYTPMVIKGLKIHPKDPFLFDFIFDPGQSKSAIGSAAFKADAQRLIKYFLASLTIKESDLWVNLSPYEKDRIIPNELGKTELGLAMLAQDYILKQLSASLLYPEKKLGKEFWSKVYAKAKSQSGGVDIPVGSLNKVWIVADKAKVLERQDAAFIVGAHLRVMMEEDYTALNHQRAILRQAQHKTASATMREVIIPEIEKEVNQGKHFATLRQMYYAMILAAWYKNNLKGAILNQVYSNQAKIGGVLSADARDNVRIYEQYLQAFKKGVFNYIKPEMDMQRGIEVPRKYFSGGLSMRIDSAMSVSKEPQAGDDVGSGEVMAQATVQIQGVTSRPRVIIFEAKGWDEALIKRLYSQYDVILEDGPLNDAYLDAHAGTLSDVEGINVFLGSRIDEHMLTRLKVESPRMTVIATRTAGTDHVNFKEAKARGIEVVNVPDYGSQAIAEHAIAMMLALAARKVPGPGETAMTRMEYGLMRLFAVLKKLDETISRGQSGNFSRNGIKGRNLLDDANPTTIYVKDSDSLDSLKIAQLGLKSVADVTDADIVWGDIGTLGTEVLKTVKSGATLINMGLSTTGAVQQVMRRQDIRVENIPQNPPGLTLQQSVIGVIGGSGKIGLHTVRLAQAIGMKVLVYDVDMTSPQAMALRDKFGFEYRPMDDILKESDVVSLHVPLIQGKTDHLIDQRAIASMKRGAMLINTARGGVVDTQAVVDGLASGQLGAAGLDVIEGDPGIFPQAGQAPLASAEDMARLNQLLSDSRVIITPHNAYNTTASEYQMLDITRQRIDESLLPEDAAMVNQTQNVKPDIHGGIDLNGANMGLEVSKEGKGVVMQFDPAMLTQFRQGHFSGVQGIIVNMALIHNPLK